MLMKDLKRIGEMLILHPLKSLKKGDTSIELELGEMTTNDKCRSE